MIKRVEAMELQTYGKLNVGTVEARVQALESVIFHMENAKGLLSLRIASLAERCLIQN